MIITKELYKLKGEEITKAGHTMFKEDIVKDLNGWRNSARDFRNENARLLKEIGTRIPKQFVEEHKITKEDKVEWESKNGKLKGELKKK